jgi:hypothetical protein
VTQSDVPFMLAEADRLLERGDFAQALSLLRRAIPLAVPDQQALANLAIAEDHERMEFRRRLSQRYPRARDLRLSEAASAIAAFRPERACTIYSALLREPAGDDAHGDLIVRLLRARAAARSRRYDLLVEDLTVILLEAGRSPVRAALRSAALRIIAEVADCDAAPMLAALVHDTAALRDRRLTGFLRRKISELEALAAAL